MDDTVSLVRRLHTDFRRERTNLLLYQQCIRAPYVVAISLLGIDKNDPESASLRESYTSVFIIEQFIIAKLWNQSRYPTTEESIKMWHIYIKEFFQ